MAESKELEVNVGEGNTSPSSTYVMSSAQRAYSLIIIIALGGAFSYAATVSHWSIQNVCALFAAFCTSLANGLIKSPRDAALSDVEEK